MSDKMSRRDFVKAGTAASVAAAVPAAAFGQAPTPTVLVRRATPPVVISSHNGHEYRNGGTRTCVEEAWQRIARGEDVLDSLIAGVNIVELDPEEMYVGYGGLPNADGVVQLDSCCMHGPLKRAGGVAALEGVRTPSRVAKAVLENTDHHLLVGAGAQAFARQMGFTIEADLNTEKSRARWLEWKRRVDPMHWLDPRKRSDAAEAARRSMVADGLLGSSHRWGTINCDGVGPKGELCGVTTTSGLAFKIPGRVGDSPILGAGLWVDDGVGAAGSTGRGEANLYNLSSFFIVEEMRRGRGPKDAAMEALKRVRANTVEKRLLDSKGNPNFQLLFYAVDKRGGYAGVSMYARDENRRERFAVCTEKGPELIDCEPLVGEAPAD
ncbi:MAG TPA: N(4)-(beta-N-acetylglucosaminyl)-L-asparaginase [Vicinamibacteria bacterium]|nr:N(4)-(beta-N-acetylglucosaminyl)-L-asparaginase [Vicinamibacteria bacterium]